jgi:hypothetical protein
MDLILYNIGDIKTRVCPYRWRLLVRLTDHGYNNKRFILNYGEPNRFAKTMGAALVDSTMKQAPNKPLVEKRPMQETSLGVPWLPPRGTQTLSGNPEETVRGGYPVFQARSYRSLLCRGPSLLMSRSRWVLERRLFPFAEWPLGILAASIPSHII